jgi:hypothetical protein
MNNNKGIPLGSSNDNQHAEAQTSGVWLFLSETFFWSPSDFIGNFGVSWSVSGFHG